MEYIRDTLTKPVQLAQLAEEATELAQAALKLFRFFDGTNPPRKTYEECMADLHEEIADVQLLLEVLHLDKVVLYEPIKQEKTNRWERHLRKNRRKAEKRHDPARVVQLEAELAAALKYISAHKECCVCKHQPSDGAPECRAVEWDCADCDKTTCKCWSCGPHANNWEWSGAYGEQ